MRKSRLRLGITPVSAEEKPKKEKEYHDIIEPQEITIAEGIKLVFSVSKTSEGNPHLDIRTWIESEKYTGPTKKGINFDVENLEEIRAILEGIDKALDRKGM